LDLLQQIVPKQNFATNRPYVRSSQPSLVKGEWQGSARVVHHSPRVEPLSVRLLPRFPAARASELLIGRDQGRFCRT
jgi:hypothetical protein